MPSRGCFGEPSRDVLANKGKFGPRQETRASLGLASDERFDSIPQHERDVGVVRILGALCQRFRQSLPLLGRQPL